MRQFLQSLVEFGAKISISKLIFTFLVLATIFLGDRLRRYNYDVVPHPGETADEYAFAWAGLSILNEGVPTAWTGVEYGYKNIWFEKINVDSIFDKNSSIPPFRLTKPWFDKPPGFAILIGAYSSLKGLKEFQQTGVAIIRRPMLWLGVFTTILVFWLGLRLYNKWVGLLSALFYSVIPTTVISSRLVLAENGYIPLYLGALIAMHYYLEKKKKLYLILASFFSCLAIVFKLSGVAVMVSILLISIMYVSKRQRIKVIATVLLIGLLGFLIFLIYGAALNWSVFKDVFFTQSGLFYGAGGEIFFSAVVRSKLTATKFFTDGWVLLAFISAFILSALEWKKHKGGSFLTISLFSYLVIFLIFGSESYGWYRFPFLPFIIIALARFTERLLTLPNMFVALGLFLFPFGTSIHRLWGIEGFQSLVLPLRFFVVGALIVFTSSFFINEKLAKKIKQLFVCVFLIIVIFLAVKEILYYNYDNWFFVT